ncbi:Stb3 protein [Maudiozyma humilis]|uniref:Stb3 protein n=1 Tax=Maudiozyma humilis TaxID=51915 RepID=A0AAV5SCG0_MAUHU|nr:Stb3 protein [Kazachstania humilis]
MMTEQMKAVEQGSVPSGDAEASSNNNNNYSNSDTQGSKPLPISSVEAQNAVHMVTPGRIAGMLEGRGPLAMRYITQTLAEEIPHFSGLSTSKQRRLIMSVMETGFQEESLVFEKIGWGLWTVKRVAPEAFVRERDATNRLNAKVRDNSSNSNGHGNENSAGTTSTTAARRRLSSNASVQKKKTLGPAGDKKLLGGDALQPLSPRMRALSNSLSHGPGGVRPAVYLDENVLQTDDEDNGVFSEEDDAAQRHASGGAHALQAHAPAPQAQDFARELIRPNGAFSFSRRKSSVVVYDQAAGDAIPAGSAEALEQELLAHRVRPLIQNRSRRSSSKGRAGALGPGVLGAGVLSPKNGSVPPLPKSLYLEAGGESASPQGVATPPRRGSFAVARGASNAQGTASAAPPPASFSEGPSRRSSSRVSVSKESGIRSTLYAAMQDAQGQPAPQVIEQREQFAVDAANTKTSAAVAGSGGAVDSPHSDTDEEDWAHIGAESLRTMSSGLSPPQLSPQHSLQGGQGQTPGQGQGNLHSTDDAARVLLSLR